MCPCSLFFFFSLPLIFTLVASSISHFLTASIKFTCYSSNEIGLLCFLSLARALSLLSTAMETLKLSRKKESALLLLFFITKSPGGYAIYHRNARVIELQNFTPAYMKGWTNVRTILCVSIRSHRPKPLWTPYEAYTT